MMHEVGPEKHEKYNCSFTIVAKKKHVEWNCERCRQGETKRSMISPRATISRKPWLSCPRSSTMPPNNKPLDQLPSSMIFFRLLPLEMASTFFVDSPL
jgi:hypothetical protein